MPAGDAGLLGDVDGQIGDGCDLGKLRRGRRIGQCQCETRADKRCEQSQTDILTMAAENVRHGMSSMVDFQVDVGLVAPRCSLITGRRRCQAGDLR